MKRTSCRATFEKGPLKTLQSGYYKARAKKKKSEKETQKVIKSAIIAFIPIFLYCQQKKTFSRNYLSNLTY